MIDKMLQREKAINASAKILLIGMILSCFGPALGYFSFFFIILSAVFCKQNLNTYLLFVFISFIITIGVFCNAYLSFDIDYFSFLVALLTIFSFLFIKNDILMAVSDRILFIVALTVPIACAISILQIFGMYPIEFRSNMVMGMMRLTFLFQEPSHYSIVLSLCSLVSLIKKTPRTIKILLFIGLLLTWSLSGFLILTLGYVGYKYYTKGMFKSLLIIFSLVFGTSLLWFFLLQDSDFWLSSKINSIIKLYSDHSVGASSALLRYNSIIMGPYFFINSIISGDIFHSLFGVGFGNLSDWVSSYYKKNYALYGITDNNNLISNVLISNGFFGVVLYIYAYIYKVCTGGSKVIFGIAMLYVVSLVSGYAFGPFAVFTLLLARIFILEVIKSEESSVY